MFFLRGEKGGPEALSLGAAQLAIGVPLQFMPMVAPVLQDDNRETSVATSPGRPWREHDCRVQVGVAMAPRLSCGLPLWRGCCQFMPNASRTVP